MDLCQAHHKKDTTHVVSFLWCAWSNSNRRSLYNNAKTDFKFFCMISTCLWCFPFGFSLPLFRTLIPMCCTAVCGQNAPCPLPETVSRFEHGAFFVPLTACIATPKIGLSNSFSVPPMPQQLECCTQRDGIIFFVLFLILYSHFCSIPITL